MSRELREVVLVPDYPLGKEFFENVPENLFARRVLLLLEFLLWTPR